jgi:hypothetical protein
MNQLLPKVVTETGKWVMALNQDSYSSMSRTMSTLLWPQHNRSEEDTHAMEAQ